MMSCVRVGEASNPGPSQNQPFVIATCNPTGLLGKASHFKEMPCGVYGVAESHLTTEGVVQFRHELRLHKVNAKYLASRPSPRIRPSVGVIGGKCTGVGFISHHPGRNLPVHWPESLHQEARTHVSSFCVQGTWIDVGILYGYAHRPTNVATQTKTDQLLSLLVDRIVNECTGPRILMGDWNQPYGVLDQEKVLLSKGFVEVQILGKSLWNREPIPTCKGSTIKDFIWISPELIPRLIDIQVDQFAFPDHALLSAVFKPFSDMQPIHAWVKPSPLPWDELETPLPNHAPIVVQPDNLDASLVEIMTQMEQGVHNSLSQSGKFGLQGKHRGRCRNTRPKVCKHPVPAIPNGRPLDHQPSFLGENFQHYMWLKQLRRLQSLVRLLSAKTTPTHLDHGVKLWEVIRKAPGFAVNFPTYWFRRTVILPNSPCVLPHALPTHAVAMIIHTTFEIEFRQLEKALWTKRVSSARASRILDSNKIFMDVAKPRAQPVQTLVKTRFANITNISEDGLEISFDRQVFNNGQPFFGPQGHLSVIELKPQSIILDQHAKLEPGDVVCQKDFLGKVTDVTQEFEKLWYSFWGRHQDTQASRWQPFVDMVKQYVPPSCEAMQLEPIDIQTWRKAVRSKKRRSAVGPDGVSRADLIGMSDAGVTALLQIIQAIESGSPWPRSLMVGLISMLEKKEEAEKVTDFRPICIFSAIYRTWASIRARQILRFLAKHAPIGLVGNRPHKETADIWWTISMHIESSLFHNCPMSGATADICKCFNALPRVPVSCLAEWLGIPHFFTSCWLRALNSMERRFVINGHAGNCISSSCGYPEGDPLSVCAMFLVNIALHSVVSAKQNTIQTWTFGDDWQFTGVDENDIDQGFDEVNSFATSLDLQLDANKCFFWGTTAGIRTGLRAQNKRVRLHERNLGGHVSYCKIPTNYTLRDRIATFESTWTWLKRSQSPLTQKLKVVYVVAWPRCLHGIANIPLGQEHFAKLRSRVMQSLNWQKKGANPLIQLSLMHGVKLDRAYQALLLTVKAFRRFCEPEVAFPLVNALSQTGTHLRCPGPCGIFLTRMFDIGWSWQGDGRFMDHEGFVFHILHTEIKTIIPRLQHAWICKIGATVAPHEGFQGMEFVSVSLTLPNDTLLEGGVRRAVADSFERHFLHQR